MKPNEVAAFLATQNAESVRRFLNNWQNRAAESADFKKQYPCASVYAAIQLQEMASQSKAHKVKMSGAESDMTMTTHCGRIMAKAREIQRTRGVAV